MNENDKEKTRITQEELDERTFWEKTKSKLDRTTLRQRILGAGTVIIVIFGILSVVVPFTIDPSTFTDENKRNAWIVRTVLLMCFAMWGVIAGEKIAEDAIMRAEGRGTYTEALKRYDEKYRGIADIMWQFDDWFIYFQKQTLRRKKIDLLISYDMAEDAEDIVDYLRQIENPIELCDHTDREGNLIKGHPIKIVDDVKKRVVIIRTKTYNQAKAIEYLKKGTVELDCDTPDYYKTSDGKNHISYLIERTKKLDDRERRDIRFSRTWKICTLLASSVFFGMVTFSDFMNAEDGQAWVNLFTRIASMVASFVSGWMTADRTVKTRTEKIDTKILVFERFEDDVRQGRFRALSHDEKAKKEEEEYEREKTDSDGTGQGGDAEPVLEGHARQSVSEETVSERHQDESVAATQQTVRLSPSGDGEIS